MSSACLVGTEALYRDLLDWFEVDLGFTKLFLIQIACKCNRSFDMSLLLVTHVVHNYKSLSYVVLYVE